MPLGLLHRLLPNKHRQDLLQCLLHFACCAHLSRAIHLPPFLFFLVFCSHSSALSPLLEFLSSSIRGLLVLPLRPSVSSVVCISPEDILSPRVGNVKLRYFPVAFFYESEGGETAVRGSECVLQEQRAYGGNQEMKGLTPPCTICTCTHSHKHTLAHFLD